VSKNSLEGVTNHSRTAWYAAKTSKKQVQRKKLNIVFC